jgi:hypothetical protein
MLLVNWFEEILGGQVIDETGLIGIYGFELRERVNTPEALIQLLRNEAGPVITREQCPRSLRRRGDQRLLPDRGADALDGLADLALDAAHRFPRLSRDFVGDTFVMQARIVREVAGRLLDFTFERLGLAFQFIAIH